jgi:hypothetical protein
MSKLIDFLKTLNKEELKRALEEMKLLTDDLTLELIKMVTRNDVD